MTERILHSNPIQSLGWGCSHFVSSLPPPGAPSSVLWKVLTLSIPLLKDAFSPNELASQKIMRLERGEKIGLCDRHFSKVVEQ